MTGNPAKAEEAILARASLATALSESTADLEQVDPDRGLKGLGLAVNRAVEFVGVLALGLIVLLIFVNSVLRYTVGGALIWTEEVVILLIPWLAAAGLFLSARRGSLIRIEYFFGLIPARIRAPLVPVGNLLCGVILFWMTWLFVDYVARFGWDRTPYLQWPKFLSSTAMVAGVALSAAAFFVFVVRELRQAALGREPANSGEA